MARWEPKTPKESLESQLKRINTRIKAKEDDIKELQKGAAQIQKAITAMG